ncbi:MAG: response regulator [Spirochaetia bacterium]|nr:response regulator [Spirochaetia bacterium]
MKNKKYIFLLDDDPDFCESIKSLLENIAKVKTFTDPYVFLKELKNSVVDLVILDYNLNHPKYDGFEIIKSIKNLNDSHLIPILMISGCDSSETVSQAFYSGIEDYVNKPIMPDFFMRKVEHTLYHSKIKLHTNALTGLPDITLIEEEFYRWRDKNKKFSVAYVDLDNFKAFNDYKGVKSGDIAIKIMAQGLKEIRNSFNKSQIYSGHIGGDDFFLIGYKTIIKSCIKKLYQLFNKKNIELFSKEEIENGFYIGYNRKGEEEKLPLITISTALITLEYSNDETFEQISAISAILKKKAKHKKGNSLAELTLPIEKASADYSLYENVLSENSDLLNIGIN